MQIVAAFILTIVVSILITPLMTVKWKGIVTVAAVVLVAVLSSIVGFAALSGTRIEYLFKGSQATGEIPVRIDALSGFFILVINITFLSGAFYGFQYMKAYREQRANLSLHCISFILVQGSLISICSLQNAIAFLIAWEIMALSSFMLIIFEHFKQGTISAGINFLIQSHICIMFLMLGFIWIALKMNSFDFKAIAAYTASNHLIAGFGLFSCFFFGFAIKAGFVPFHTWLPYAHPAAPSHVSGIMSGVIIKIGIYGILRMLLLIKSDYLFIGYGILFISLLTGIYGVMLAIVQHDLKRLLAYHSIENIGIIGIGIGLGCIGLGKGNNVLSTLGFAGALLHTLNHSLFKSLLFYGAGNVYQSTQTMDIEKLGGIGKPMVHTSFLFLMSSIAICGLPPFNGFASEFLIYKAMFSGLRGSDKLLVSTIVCGLFGLALIGGLAMLCFTKAFGTVFLGTARHRLQHRPRESSAGKLWPMYSIALLMSAIGLIPTVFVKACSKAISLFTSNDSSSVHFVAAESIERIGISAAGFIVMASLIYFMRKWMTVTHPVEYSATWNCGYTGPTTKMQFTASSYVRAYRKLAEPIFSIQKKKKEIEGVFPQKAWQETHPYDKAEQWFIDYPLQLLKRFFNWFRFLQNGNLQSYILYGVAFITLVLGIPFIVEYILTLFHFLNNL